MGDGECLGSCGGEGLSRGLVCGVADGAAVDRVAVAF